MSSSTVSSAGPSLKNQQVIEQVWQMAFSRFAEGAPDIVLPRGLKNLIGQDGIDQIATRYSSLIGVPAFVFEDASIDSIRMIKPSTNSAVPTDPSRSSRITHSPNPAVFHNRFISTQDSSPSDASLSQKPNVRKGKSVTKEAKIPRPPNAFILYRQHHHPSLKEAHPEMHNNEISVILGAQWKSEAPSVKAQFQSTAEALKRKHAQEFPEYQYQPRKPSEKKRRKTSGKAAAISPKSSNTSGGPEISYNAAASSSAPPSTTSMAHNSAQPHNHGNGAASSSTALSSGSAAHFSNQSPGYDGGVSSGSTSNGPVMPILANQSQTSGSGSGSGSTLPNATSDASHPVGSTFSNAASTSLQPAVSNNAQGIGATKGSLNNGVPSLPDKALFLDDVPDFETLEGGNLTISLPVNEDVLMKMIDLHNASYAPFQNPDRFKPGVVSSEDSAVVNREQDDLFGLIDWRQMDEEIGVGMRQIDQDIDIDAALKHLSDSSLGDNDGPLDMEQELLNDAEFSRMFKFF